MHVKLPFSVADLTALCGEWSYGQTEATISQASQEKAHEKRQKQDLQGGRQHANSRLTEEKLEMNRELTEQRNTIDDLNKSRDESIKRGRRTANAITSTARRVKTGSKGIPTHRSAT